MSLIQEVLEKIAEPLVELVKLAKERNVLLGEHLTVIRSWQDQDKDYHDKTLDKIGGD